MKPNNPNLSGDQWIHIHEVPSLPRLSARSYMIEDPPNHNYVQLHCMMLEGILNIYFDYTQVIINIKLKIITIIIINIKIIINITIIILIKYLLILKDFKKSKTIQTNIYSLYKSNLFNIEQELHHDEYMIRILMN